VASGDVRYLSACIQVRNELFQKSLIDLMGVDVVLVGVVHEARQRVRQPFGRQLSYSVCHAGERGVPLQRTRRPAPTRIKASLTKDRVLLIVFANRPVLTGVSRASIGSNAFGSAGISGSGRFNKRPADRTAAAKTFRRSLAASWASSSATRTSASVRLISGAGRALPWTFLTVDNVVGRAVAVSGDDIGRQGMSVVSIWANYHKVDGTIAWRGFSQAL